MAEGQLPIRIAGIALPRASGGRSKPASDKADLQPDGASRRGWTAELIGRATGLGTEVGVQ